MMTRSPSTRTDARIQPVGSDVAAALGAGVIGVGRGDGACAYATPLPRDVAMIANAARTVPADVMGHLRRSSATRSPDRATEVPWREPRMDGITSGPESGNSFPSPP